MWMVIFFILIVLIISPSLSNDHEFSKSRLPIRRQDVSNIQSAHDDLFRRGCRMPQLIAAPVLMLKHVNEVSSFRVNANRAFSRQAIKGKTICAVKSAKLKIASFYVIWIWHNTNFSQTFSSRAAKKPACSFLSKSGCCAMGGRGKYHLLIHRL